MHHVPANREPRTEDTRMARFALRHAYGRLTDAEPAPSQENKDANVLIVQQAGVPGGERVHSSVVVQSEAGREVLDVQPGQPAKVGPCQMLCGTQSLWARANNYIDIGPPHTGNQRQNRIGVMLTVGVQGNGHFVSERTGESQARLGRAPCAEAERQAEDSRSRRTCDACRIVRTAVVDHDDVAAYGLLDICDDRGHSQRLVLRRNHRDKTTIGPGCECVNIA